MPTPEEVVGRGCESESYLDQFKIDQDKLLQLIASNGNPMLPAPPVADEVGA